MSKYSDEEALNLVITRMDKKFPDREARSAAAKELFEQLHQFASSEGCRDRGLHVEKSNRRMMGYRGGIAGQSLRFIANDKAILVELEGAEDFVIGFTNQKEPAPLGLDFNPITKRFEGPQKGDALVHVIRRVLDELEI